MSASAEPTDVNVDNGQGAIWFEDTATAPMVHFKGKDSAGAVFVASLPITPA